MNFQLFENDHFWGCDVENRVWTKLALWICPILWIRVKMGYTQLSLTFFYQYRPNRPIYHTIKKIIFPKKNAIFLVENLPQKGQNWFNSKTTIVPSPHKHSLQTHNNGFFISQHRIFRLFLSHPQKMPFSLLLTKPTNEILLDQDAEPLLKMRVGFGLKYACLNV